MYSAVIILYRFCVGLIYDTGTMFPWIQTWLVLFNNVVLAAAAADAAAATVVVVVVAAVVPGDPGLDSREQCCHLAIF